jgi:uncharacterized protein YjdB
MAKRAVLVLAALLLPAACSDSSRLPTDEEQAGPAAPPPPAPPGPSPHLIGLTPVKSRIDLGRSVQLTAVALNEQQQTMPFARITWHSSQPEVARVDTVGRVSALSPGHVYVTASSGGAAAYASVHVMRDGLYPDIVVLSPAIESIGTCESVQLTAATLPDVATPSFTWRSSNEAVLKVDNSGVVQGIAAGTAGVTALWQPDTTRRATRAVQVTAC